MTKHAEILDIDDFLKREEVALFKSTDGEIYFRQSNKVYCINDKKVQYILAAAHKDKFEKLPKQARLNEYVHQLELLARVADEVEIPLHLRVAKDGDDFVYDLGDSAIKTNGEKWEEVKQPKVLFKRHGNYLKQDMPKKVSKTRLKDVLKFINIANKEDQLLFMIYLVSCFIPDLAHPIPAFYGEKGASKSTAMRVVRKLVDPARQELMTLPKSQNELAQICAHNYMPAFDNMDKLKSDSSDMLCSVVTGGAINKRKLFTDDSDVIIGFKSCVTVNGVNLVATKSDLLDRSILFELTRIDECKRRTETDFWDEFNKEKSLLLGAIFTVLSKAMDIMHKGFETTELPRMADFSKWGYAIAEAAGLGGNNFLQAYKNNIAKVNAEVIAEDPIAQAIVNSMKKREPLSEFATELLQILKKENPKLKLPPMPNAFSRHLRTIAGNLEAQNIKCNFVTDTTANKTKITLKNLGTITAAIPSDAAKAVTNDSPAAKTANKKSRVKTKKVVDTQAKVEGDNAADAGDLKAS